MAQEVGYFENHIEYEEGPFVMVDAHGWRVEVELKGHHCPCLPGTSIYALRKALGFPVGKGQQERIAGQVDKLNQLVCEGYVVLENNAWVWNGKLPEEEIYDIVRGN